MKYPQLVSTRAVNAISDWLVSRLEQLGVEAPQLYTRLLLSLLQSSVQINDPIEFSNLETFFANLKGNNRRYLPSDTDTLKKLNAVQCLREIVSAEQEIASIEKLVDELCAKLKDIEKQTTGSEDEDQSLVVTLSVGTTNASVASSAATVLGNNNRTFSSPTHHPHINSHHKYNSSSNNNNNNKEKEYSEEPTAVAAAAAVDDIETDPKKRYFRAFPALTKEMEDSFRVWRRNAKSLTWPVDRSALVSIRRGEEGGGEAGGTSSSASSSSSSTLSTSFGSAAGGGGLAASAGRGEDIQIGGAVDSKATGGGSIGSNVGLGNLNLSNYDNATAAAAGVVVGVGSSLAGGVKRKSKRRRNQAMSKGKTIQNIRKNSTGNAIGAGSVASGLQGGIGGMGRQHQHRNSSPTFWDTDFEGSWEMGRDLIKEFIVKQNRNNRNRSTSESAAYSMRGGGGGRSMQRTIDGAENKRKIATEALMPPPPPPPPPKQVDEGEREAVIAANKCKISSPLLPVVDISFCCDDDEKYDDTLASVSEPAVDASILAVAATVPRRLYQRDISFGEVLLTDDEESVAGCAANAEEEDFAQFKAKFNSDVEALWHDADGSAETFTTTAMDVFSMPTVFAANSGAPTVGGGALEICSLPPAVAAPFKENLKDFWTNYYSHHFDLTKMPASQQSAATASIDAACGDASKMDESCASPSCSGGGRSDGSCSGGCVVNNASADASANTSDYYSMPSNIDDLEKSAGGGNHQCTPIGMFLQNSIWSENSQAGAADTDESFYLKVWNSTKKLNQLDAAHGSKITASSGGAPKHLHGSSLHFPPYNALKWSEGINAGPCSQLQQHQQQQLRLQIGNGTNNNNSSSNKSISINASGADCTDSSATASVSVVSSTSCSSSAAFTTHSSAALAAAAAYSWQTPATGQPLQADLQSWSSSNPMSLTEMYGDCGGSGASVTDGNFLATTIAPSSPTPPHSALCETAAIIGPSVTLSNHSTSGSGFVEYARIKAAAARAPLTLANTRGYPPASSSQLVLRSASAAPPVPPPPPLEEEENLLTSERTHFHPIKTYADGHTFDICSALDVVEYERSASGYLYLDAERYLAYTRNDSFMAEEEATTAVGASAAPLYAASNCEAALSVAAAKNRSKGIKGKGDELIIKFRLRNCEVACQTAPQDDVKLLAGVDVPLGATTAISTRQHPLCLIFGSAASGIKLQTTGLACNDAIEALNKAVAAAAKAAAAAQLPTDSHWLPTATVSEGGECAYFSSAAALWTRPQDVDIVGGSDEVDFYDGGNRHDLQQQWSMHEIGKKCQLKGHNNNNNGNSSCSGSGGNNNNNSMWGMCAACNSESEFKSAPANRALRDELQLEADEIMSDLKYMQDLYIGKSVGSDADVEDSGCDDVGEGVIDNNENEWGQLDAANMWNQNGQIPMDQDQDEPQFQLQPQTQVEVLQQVNRLIADLLRPDNAATQQEQQQQKAKKQQQFSGSLWYDNLASRNIWQQPISSGGGGGDDDDDDDKDVSSGTLKTTQLLRQFNTEPSTANANASIGGDGVLDDDSFLAQLSWDHANLAAIWQKHTPPSTGATQQQEPSEITAAAANDEAISENSIADKNLKNLQASFEADKSPAINANVAYKRVQQFLSTNPTAAMVAAVAANANIATTAKLKLANRKRRHSASQNFFHLPPQNLITTGNGTNTAAAAAAAAAAANYNNNNNAEIANLNCFNLKLISSTAERELDVQKFISSSLRHALAKKCNSNRTAAADETQHLADCMPAEQTIITCKYWTTLDPLSHAHGQIATEDAVNFDEVLAAEQLQLQDSAATTFSCLIDKSASILKHVTMVTRPLTR